jgi:hypothetical protein
MSDILDRKSWGFEPWITSTKRYDPNKLSLLAPLLGRDNMVEYFKAVQRARDTGKAVAIASFANGVMLHAEADCGFTVTGHGEDCSDITEFECTLLTQSKILEGTERVFGRPTSLVAVLAS